MLRIKKERIIKNNAGFTLIELLVVVSIIGILSSFAVVSLNIARVKARNALRKGDMSQMRTALNLYYDIHQEYPICSVTWDDTLVNYGANNSCYNIELNNALTSGATPLVDRLPRDPRNRDNLTVTEDAENGNDEYIYKYVSDPDGRQYIITYRLEGDMEDKIFRGR